MPPTTCGWCSAYSQMQAISVATTISHKFSQQVSVMAAIECTSCGRCSIGTSSADKEHLFHEPDTWLERMGEYVERLPKVGIGRDYPDVPEHTSQPRHQRRTPVSVSERRERPSPWREPCWRPLPRPRTSPPAASRRRSTDRRRLATSEHTSGKPHTRFGSTEICSPTGTWSRTPSPPTGGRCPRSSRRDPA